MIVAFEIDISHAARKFCVRTDHGFRECIVQYNGYSTAYRHFTACCCGQGDENQVCISLADNCYIVSRCDCCSVADQCSCAVISRNHVDSSARLQFGSRTGSDRCRNRRKHDIGCNRRLLIISAGLIADQDNAVVTDFCQDHILVVHPGDRDSHAGFCRGYAERTCDHPHIGVVCGVQQHAPCDCLGGLVTIKNCYREILISFQFAVFLFIYTAVVYVICFSSDFIDIVFDVFDLLFVFLFYCIESSPGESGIFQCTVVIQSVNFIIVDQITIALCICPDLIFRSGQRDFRIVANRCLDRIVEEQHSHGTGYACLCIVAATAHD